MRRTIRWLFALTWAARALIGRRTARLAEEATRLERMVSERTRELADANRKLDTIAHLDGLKEDGILILSGNTQRHCQVTRPDECEVESRRCNGGVDVLNCGGVFYGGNCQQVGIGGGHVFGHWNRPAHRRIERPP